MTSGCQRLHDAGMDNLEGIKMEPTVQSRDLGSVAGFSETDRWDNRQGRLSPDQKVALRQALLGELLGLALVIGFVILGFGILHAVIGSTIASIGIVILLCRVVGRLAELRDGIVDSVEGDAWTECVPDSEGPDRYWLHIPDLKLETADQVHTAFAPGGPYRIYYAPSSNSVVGAEQLPGWRPVQPPTRKRFRWFPSIELGSGG
jgi:hypothetical protein